MSGSVGVLTTDQDLVVTSWDAWLESATGIPHERACGLRLHELYPELEERGIAARIRRVIRQGTFEVFAAAFHKYVIPCPPREPSAHFDRMRQFVTIAPIRAGDVVTGVSISIEDVTPRVESERDLLMQLDSGDEETRLRAVQSFAVDRRPSEVLSEGIKDPSWRVRRATAAGLAAGGGTHTAGALIEALREHHGDPSVLSAALTAIVTSRDDLVAELLGLVDSEDADLRTYAALALGLVRDVRAVPTLMRMLGDESANVRYHAIEALGRIGDRSAAEQLARIAETRDFFLAFAAIDALAAIGEPSVAARLVPLLDDPMLAAPTATCLGAIGSEDVVGPLATRIGAEDAPVAEIGCALATLHHRIEQASGEGGIVADLARGLIDERAAALLLDALGHADETVAKGLITVIGWLRHESIDARLGAFLTDHALRFHVANVLSERGTRAIQALLAVAPELDAEGKKLLAMALGRIGSAKGVEYLVEQLGGDPPVIVAAAGALGAIGDRGAFQPLLATLDHPVDAVRRAGVGAINSIGHPDTEATVLRLLREQSPRLRESAARIAGYFGYPGALAIMVDLARDRDEHVRRAVVEHLTNFEDAGALDATVGALRGDAAPSVRGAAARAVAQSDDPAALDALLQACGDDDTWVRYYAARGLGRRVRAGDQVLEALRGLALDDAAPPVRIAAIDAIASVGDHRLAAALERAASDPEREVAEAALRAMGAFPPLLTRASLADALGAADPGRRMAALAAVSAQRNEEWIPLLRQVGNSGGAEERQVAVRALREIGTARSIAAMIQLAESMQLRPMVLTHLSTLEPERIAFIGDALTYEKEGVRCMVVEALGRARHPAAARLLVAALDDPSSSVRLAARQALSRMDLRGLKAQFGNLAGGDAGPSVGASSP